MKILCPACGMEGYLQKRGNSLRIQHYLEYTNGKRMYKYHKISREYLDSLEVNESKTAEVRNTGIILKSNNMDELQTRCPGSIVRSSIGGCRPPDPGSNPGQGAISFELELNEAVITL